MKRLIQLFALLVLAASASRAEARDVFFNGVKLADNVILKNQTFPSCEVKFDGAGNIHITAKGIKVEIAPAGGDGESAAPPAGHGDKLTKRYWLVSKQTKRGISQYDVDVFLNDRFVKKIRAIDDPTVLEVTKYVVPGPNRARLVAVKNLGDKRISSSPVDVLEIVLGEGAVGGGTVTVNKALITYQRNASETSTFRNDFDFAGR